MNLHFEKVSKQGFELPKKDLDKLLNILRKYGRVIGPVKDSKWLRMKPIQKADEMTFKGISWFTSKKYVFPEKQTLFSFDGDKVKKFSYNSKTVLFGLRMCDLNSFFINDKLFLENGSKNHNYEKLRKDLTLVGLWCDEQQDKYCFCDSMDLKHYYDLCLFDKKDYFHVKPGSIKGEEILGKLKLKLDTNYWKELPDCKMKLSTTQIKKHFDKDIIWKKGSNDCLSCGDCTTLCPTCLCFDIEDEVNLDLKSGVRFAKWDSCMYKHFTLVAGGHVYRNNRLNRFKHRIYHKLDYFPSKFNELMCTGCGRCIRGCPTKIDWVSLVNEMEAEK